MDAAEVIGTVLAGVLVVVIGQWFVRSFLEPILEMRKLIEEINKDQLYFANMFGSSKRYKPARITEAKEAFRSQAGRLSGAAQTVRWYPLARRFGLRKKEKLLEASKCLVALADFVASGKTSEALKCRKELGDLLGFTDFFEGDN